MRERASGGGQRLTTVEEARRLREFFGRHVLPGVPDPYILRKYYEHVEGDQQWPSDTTPEQYLESLRETILDARSGIYLSFGASGEWTIYFVGRVRRRWRGPGGSNRILVILNAERRFFITGFQPSRDDEYVERQGGFWVHRQ